MRGVKVMRYATSMPGATFEFAFAALFGASTLNTVESTFSTFSRRFTLSLLRKRSVVVYLPCGSKASKTTSGGLGWKSGSSSGTIDSTLCVNSDMLSSPITRGRRSATACRAAPFSSAASCEGARLGSGGSSALSLAYRRCAGSERVLAASRPAAATDIAASVGAGRGERDDS